MEQHQQQLQQQERQMTKQGVVNIKGKNYKTVALRVQEFREQFPTYFLTTEIVKIDDEQCIVKAYAGVHLEGGQVQKHGGDKNRILRTCVERSWKGFNANWLEQETGVMLFLLVVTILTRLTRVMWTRRTITNLKLRIHRSVPEQLGLAELLFYSVTINGSYPCTITFLPIKSSI